MNYKSLASKGRYGDTELRNVAGRRSHVNPREADIIDLWGALGESLVQREGAGTVNPKTGMPEYHNLTSMHTHIDANNRPTSSPYGDDVVGYKIGNDYYDNEGNLLGGMELETPQGDWADENPYEDPPPPPPPPDPEYSITHEGDVAEIIQNIMLEGGYDPQYDFNNDNVVDVLDITAGISAGEYDESDYTPFDPTVDGEFAPSRDEFRQFIESGNIDELLEGFGGEWTESDFADIMDTDKLGFLQEGYGLQTGKLESDKTITGGILQSNLESAKGQYGRGLEAAGYNVGKSLFNIKGQVEGQKSKGGFAGSGFIAATGERAKRGLFQDYRAQQRELSAGLGEAKTAFDWGTQSMEADYTYGMDTARLGLKTDIHDFWSDKYEDFYDRLDWLQD